MQSINSYLNTIRSDLALRRGRDGDTIDTTKWSSTLMMIPRLKLRRTRKFNTPSELASWAVARILSWEIWPTINVIHSSSKAGIYETENETRPAESKSNIKCRPTPGKESCEEGTTAPRVDIICHYVQFWWRIHLPQASITEELRLFEPTATFQEPTKRL